MYSGTGAYEQEVAVQTEAADDDLAAAGLGAIPGASVIWGGFETMCSITFRQCESKGGDAHVSAEAWIVSFIGGRWDV